VQVNSITRNIAYNARNTDISNFLWWDCSYTTSVVRETLDNTG